MNTDNSFSSNSMSKKRERLEQGERLNARAYKKLFKIAGQKMKEASQGDVLITASDASKKVNETETPVLKCCSEIQDEKHRVTLDLQEVCLDNPESEREHPQMDGDECVSVLKTGPTCSAELSSEVWDHVNKLCDYWHRGHNSVFFDGQDRIIKVVHFVLSMVNSVKQPILIITPARSLSLWEIEFPKWSKSTNVVTYKGNNDVRTVIRSNEFYTENGSIKFQVLLSSPEVIAEDLEIVNHIKWELVVIDECQHSRISRIFKKINSLSVVMKLLTATSEIVEGRQGYRNILSLLDSKYQKTRSTSRDADVDTNTLKERLSPFLAFECNLNASEIEEYWVPVHLSHVQIQQYCSMLNSSMDILSSYSKNTPSLHHILTQIQKCCDHPYLVDPTLRENLQTDDQLDAEISVSGKLQLVDKLLLEIKRLGLRALILFQSVVNSEKTTIGDILENIVDQRFGKDSYIRIQPNINSRSVRDEAVDKFNDIEKGIFICLLDYRDCQSTITLSSMDVAIQFNSNWNPSYDLKDLRKLSLYPSRLKVLRLYSPFTIEEKALILSKQGMTLEIYTYWIAYKTCHRLLTWGASYLFKKLSKNTESKSNFLDDLVKELSSLLLNTVKTPSISTNAKQYNGVYSENIIMMGESEATKDSCSIEEYLMENEPNIFWSNLFKENERTHSTRSGGLSRRVKVSFRNLYYWDFDNHAITSTFVNTKRRSKRKPRAQVKLKGLQLPRLPSTCISDSGPLISSRNDVGECPDHQPPQPQTFPVIPPLCDQSSETNPLDTELENIKKEKEKITKFYVEKKSMLLSECENEISEVCKKYAALIKDSEMHLTVEEKDLEGYYDLVYANHLLAQSLNEAHLQKTDEDRKEWRGSRGVGGGRGSQGGWNTSPSGR